MSNYLSDYRYKPRTTCGTSASAEDLLPGVRNIIDTIPDHPSQLPLAELGTLTDPDQTWRTASRTRSTWRSNGRGKTPPTIAKYGDWAKSNMAAMSQLATGIQLADENLGQRPARFASDEAMVKLDRYAPSTTRTACSTAGWDESDGHRPLPRLP